MNTNTKKVIVKLNSLRINDVNDFIFHIKENSNTLAMSNLSSNSYQKFVRINIKVVKLLVNFNTKANKSNFYKTSFGTLVRYFQAVIGKKKFIEASKLLAISDDELFITELYLQALEREVDEEAKNHLIFTLAINRSDRVQSIFNVQYSEEIERTNNYICGIWSRKMWLILSMFFKRIANRLTRGMR